MWQVLVWMECGCEDVGVGIFRPEGDIRLYIFRSEGDIR